MKYMSYENFAKKTSKQGEWCKHFRRYGKRKAAKVVRQMTKVRP